jgi:ATP-dependent helicase/nuclease subunit A
VAEAAPRYASPSTYAEGRQGAAPSPVAEGSGLGRFRRGDLVHRLLQLLPDLPAEARADGARRLLLKERDLTDPQRAEMAAAALGVLNDDRFAEVFGPGSRAEAAVAGSAPGLPKGLAVSGRVDRMVVTPERVLVVDFKSNRPSPDRIEDADAAYLTQMAIYVAVLRAIFPRRAVEAALVWTDGPKLMPIPENLVEDVLASIAQDD